MRISNLPAESRVPFLDVGATYRELKVDIDLAMTRVLESGVFIQGEEVRQFETEFADYVGANHCVGVGNGLESLRLALRAIGVAAGDEVLVPSHTFVATWLAVTQCGATPVGIDTEPNGFNIDVESIESAINSRTRAIVMVHLYGLPSPIDKILEIARRNNLMVVEDAAQAHGSVYRNRRIGSHSDIVSWSFYPGKNLGAFGDGGAVTTNNSEFAGRVRQESNYGSRLKYHHDILGTNSRLDPLQAAVLRVKLRSLDVWNDRRRRIASRYISELGLNLASAYKQNAVRDSSWHLFVIETKVRDRLRDFLAGQGIETMIHYPVPPYRQLAYRDLYPGIRHLRTERLASTVLSLPIGPHMGDSEVSKVIDAIWSSNLWDSD